MRSIGRWLWLWCSVLALSAPAAFGEVQRLEGRGWAIDADPEAAVLTIGYQGPGELAREVRLNLRQGDALLPLTGWTARVGHETLFIDHPQARWQFGLGNEALRVSCSSGEGALTATLPAGPERIPARLLDPAGRPVDWDGTTEVTHSYGGVQTRHQSFLPRENPEVLYLALGQVESSNFHCLFDRGSDTGIEFPAGSRLRRDRADQDLMAVTIPVPGEAFLKVHPDYYTRTLGLPFYAPLDRSPFDRAPVVWNSWTYYYAAVTERDMVASTDWIAANLKPYAPGMYVTLDDGCERGADGEHYWTSNWDQRKFPHGGKWLAQYIKGQGLKPGLWLVPNAWAGAVETHPEWYLRDKAGNLILDYHTPALDCTNPEVLQHLRELFATLKDWGFEYYKFDGEHALAAYAPAVDRSRLHDPSLDPIAAYRHRLRVIREAAGRETFIEACPSGTPLNGIGIVNSYFNGDDVYNSWRGEYPFFVSLNANLFLNGIVSYIMPGEGISLHPQTGLEQAERFVNEEFLRIARTRETGASTMGATLAEARTMAAFSVLSGATYSLADNLTILPEERVELLRRTLPTLPIVPVDLFSRGGYMHWDLWEEFTREQDYHHDLPRVLDLKVNAAAGVYDVVGLTNWSGTPERRELEFGDKLGLDPAASFLVFDAWDCRLEGTFRERFTAAVAPHDTRVLLIRPRLERPQLLATDRHLTSAVGIERLDWEEASRTVSGTAETIPGRPCRLYFHVPAGTPPARVQAGAKVLGQRLSGELLEVTLQGQAAPVEWRVSFGR